MTLEDGAMQGQELDSTGPLLVIIFYDSKEEKMLKKIKWFF